MEEENLNPELPPQPSRPTHHKEIVGILGIFLTTAIFVAAIFFLKTPEQINKEQIVDQNSAGLSKPTPIYALNSGIAAQERKNNTQSTTIIYGEYNGANMVFISLDPIKKEKKQLFSISSDKVGNIGKSGNNGKDIDIKFCSAANKIYMITGSGTKLGKNFQSPTTTSPSTNISVKEIDFSGNMRNLDFTAATVPFYEEQITYYDSNDFILSRDCQKIVWSTSYYKDDEAYKSEIFVADINGGGKKVLQTFNLSPNNYFGKIPVSWSNTDPNVVYLTSYDFENYHYGGLYKLDLKTNYVSQIKAVPSENVIMEISNNDNLIAHQQDYKDGSNTKEEGFITNLAQQSTLPLKIDNYTKRKFSTDNSMIAYIARPCVYERGLLKSCVIDLHVFDLNKKTDKLVSKDVDRGSGFLDWLTNDSVISLGNRNDLISKSQDDRTDLIMTNINDGKITKLASVSAVFLYVGILGR